MTLKNLILTIIRQKDPRTGPLDRLFEPDSLAIAARRVAGMMPQTAGRTAG
jgi:hypothetical protein